jgi:NAD(P)-dependent dehydrogenase (short-subunit alcohol dehydrogenase family)
MQRGARIVNVASRAYLAGYAHSPYITSKAGVIGLTRSMAIDLAERGIFVNAIAPGLIETDMFRSLTPERQQELIAKQPTRDRRAARGHRQRHRVLREPAHAQRHGPDPDAGRRPLDGDRDLLTAFHTTVR